MGSNKFKSLEDIFNDDEFHLIEAKKKRSGVRTADQRLSSSFQEINDFYSKHKREPDADSGDIQEKMLAFRLTGLREDEGKTMALEPEDEYGLLKHEEKEINSIDDILDDNFDGIFDDDDLGLFDLKHVKKEIDMPDYIARRKPCRDFEEFEHKLIQCQKELGTGVRHLTDLKHEQSINEGSFYVLNGVLLYVDKVGKKELDKNNKLNSRLRCIFENGTESDMLLRSLSTGLFKGGKCVTEPQERLLDNFKNVSKDDKSTGWIYVLKSLSTDPDISSIHNLYKIGYSTTTVDQRIKDAEKQTTYLNAPVQKVYAGECFNMNTQKFEDLLHTFFDGVRLRIDITNRRDIRHSPREWFIVPLNIIEQAIDLLVTGEIIHYRYDSELEMIIKK